MSLASDLRTVLEVGTYDDLRAFLESIGKEACTEVLNKRFKRDFPVRCYMYPLEVCIRHHELERAAILIEFGAIVDWPAFTTAVSASAEHRSLLILELISNEARAQGRLARLIGYFISPNRGDVQCLHEVVQADFAPALAFLLDAGLPLDDIKIRSGCGDMYIEFTMLTAAAFCEAPECLRLLCSRMPAAEWATKDDVYVHAGPKILGSLISAIDTTGAAPLPFEAVRADLDVYLAQIRARDRALPPDKYDVPRKLPTVADAEVAEVRAAAADWDLRTRVEMYATLTAMRRDYKAKRLCNELFMRARVSAFAAALTLGCTFRFGWGTWTNPDNLCDRAALTAVFHALAVLEPGDEEIPRLPWRILETLDIDWADTLLSSSKLPVALFLTDVGLAFSSPGRALSSVRNLFRSDVYSRDDAGRLEGARLIFRCHYTRGLLRQSLSSALEHGDLVLAEAFLGSGVKINVSSLTPSSQDGLSYCQMYRGLSRGRTPASMLPSAADAQVEAACAPAVMAGFDAAAARAHASAAEAEEERLLAALLQDSSYLDVVSGRRRHVSSRYSVAHGPTDWYSVVMPVLTVRWLSPRLRKADLQCMAEMGRFSDATKVGSARCVRFLISRCGLTLKKCAPKLPGACYAGNLELAWALLLASSSKHADPGSAHAEPTASQGGTRDRIVRKHLSEAIAGVVSATLNQRCKFPSGLADALVAAGGRVSHFTLTRLAQKLFGHSGEWLYGGSYRSSCSADVDGGGFRRAEALRALRWALGAACEYGAFVTEEAKSGVDADSDTDSDADEDEDEDESKDEDEDEDEDEDDEDDGVEDNE